jgi:hypothetical protein
VLAIDSHDGEYLTRGFAPPLSCRLRHLGGIDYPASKDEVVATAESNGAPQDIIDALQRMDSEEFDGPNAVQAALT